ncbi:hypothetical protein DV702_16460 [Sporosarcina sp. PTS2304]|nr:hypothetical protein DV702_16460 [Sporosarcina sp. PTS2304]
MTGVIANALLASPPRALQKASGSAGRILARTLFFCTIQEKLLILPQFLNEHQLTSRQKLKDSPGRTGDSWRISTTGVIATHFWRVRRVPSGKRPVSLGRILAHTLLFCTGEVTYPILTSVRAPTKVLTSLVPTIHLII